MKHSLLFVLSSFAIGGTTVSTRNLIAVLDKDKYDIYVLALNPNGVLKWMYDDVKQIPTCFTAKALALSGWREETIWYRRLLVACIRFTSHHSECMKFAFYRHIEKKCLRKFNFNTVIACQEGLLSDLVSKFDCSNLVAWVRCDYQRYFSSNNFNKEPFYQKYNHIVCVAETTKKSFTEIYPEYLDRTVCIYNPQDSNLINSQSDLNDNDQRFRTNGIVLLSLGRLDKVKRFDKIPFIANKMKKMGLNFTWYIVGDGGESKLIADNIQQYGVSECVIMLGAKSNPHFYIKRADLYVCLSSSEACPRVINEAKILGTPVVSTDFPTVFEYLVDGVDGRIASIENIPNTIVELFTDNNLYIRIKSEISKFHFDNAQLIKNLEVIL